MQNFFPLVWDSTQLSAYNSCQIRWFRNHVQHLQQKESTDLIAGGAFAHGVHKARVAFYENKASTFGAINVGIEALYEEYGDYFDPFKPAKSSHRMALALESYFNEYDLKYDECQPLQLSDGKYSIEYSMLEPILDANGNPLLHPTLKLPLLFSGRIDMLAKHAGGIYLVDEKTTGSYFSKNWAHQWQTRGQFTGYVWLARQSNIPELHNVIGAIIRGICVPTSTATKQETIDNFYSSIETIKHISGITARNDHEVDCWHRDMLRSITAALGSYTEYLSAGEKEPEKYFSGNWGSSCTDYGRGCMFIDTCKSPNGERFLESELEQYIWRPELHKRQLLDEYLLELSSLSTSKGE